jgi:rhodanese-related sulfurtransferase
MKTVMTLELEYEMRKKAVSIIDVREKEEYEYGHIKGSINIPLSYIQMHKIDDLDKGKEYYIVCRTGSRSLDAARILKKQGYQVINVLGGIATYKGELV